MFEAFAGYGGASFGLHRADIPFQVVAYSEIDKFASVLYNANHCSKSGEVLRNWGDITSIDVKSLPDFDLFTGGFPCQPFSTSGLQAGEKDSKGRGTLLYDILRICKVKKPRYILLENVKGFASERFSATFTALKNTLKEIGYGDLKYSLLNTKEYGIPQNRERIWIFAKYGGLPEDFSMIPPTIQSDLRLKDFLDPEPEEFLYLSPQQIERIQDFYRLPNLEVKEPSCLDLYNRKIRKDGLSVTILAPHHNKMRLIEPPTPTGEIPVRKYSVMEQFRLMGFQDGELDFNNQSYTQLSTRAANGWDINLVSKLLKHIFTQLS